jgi:hypothetical protein
MLPNLSSVVGILVGIGGPDVLGADVAGPAPAQVRAAIARSLPLLEKSATEYTKHRQCFSCHHQALPVLALTAARGRGFEVSAEVLQKQLRHTADFLGGNRDNYRKGRGQGGRVDTAGYALLTLELGGWKPDDTTAAVVEFLLQTDRKLDHWLVSGQRPPSEYTPFTTTYLALRALRTFGAPAQQEAIADRVDQVSRWLLVRQAREAEERVFRLRALRVAGAADVDLREAAQELLRSQRADGGWAQTDKMESDAYATGSVLVALHEAGGLAVDDPAYRRGLAFLTRTQRDDGSWHVRSRSRPFQVYFESGFPHGKDQFISIAASGWATAALALACPPVPEPLKAPRLLSARNRE